MRKIILIIPLLSIAFAHTNAQSFDIYKGDTINYINKNNIKEGTWIIFKAKTKIILQKGNYLNGKKEGLWTSFYSEGQKKSKITYIQGIKKGYAIIYFKNGNIAEEGTWMIDKWVGKYKSYYKNGKLFYSWNFNDKGNRCGYQQYFYENGRIKIEGDWEDGKKNGKIKEYFISGNIKTERTFKEGELDIKTIMNYEIPKNNNIITDTNLNEINPVDTNTTQYKKTDTIKVFQETGYYMFYNKNKKVEKEGMFSKGILTEGKYYIYDETGKLIKTSIYKNGKIVKIIVDDIEE